MDVKFNFKPDYLLISIQLQVYACKRRGDKAALFIILFFTFIIANSQNLINNPGFERITSYPTISDQISKSITWYSPTGGTPDLFNENTPDFKNKYAGHIDAHSGDGYSGLILYKAIHGHQVYREYLQTKLKEPLKKDKEYIVQMYARIKKNKYSSYYALNSIGTYFSKKPIKLESVENIKVKNPVNCFTESKNFIEDTVKWVLITSRYKANGGEQYLTIGNFRDNRSTDKKTVFKDVMVKESYYYLDDIAVTAVDDTILKDKDTVPDLTIYFKPNSYKIDSLYYEEIKSLITSLCREQNIEIIGYADSTFQSAYNQKLSEQRAQAVAKLLAETGIDKSRMVIKGKGEDASKANDTAKIDKSKHRRVEIYIVQ